MHLEIYAKIQFKENIYKEKENTRDGYRLDLD